MENCNIQSDLKKYTFEENIQYQAAESLSKRISLTAKAEYEPSLWDVWEGTGAVETLKSQRSNSHLGTEKDVCLSSK